jgi:hypothetical protein
MNAKEALQQFGLPARPTDRKVIGALLTLETERERQGKGQPEILRTLCAQLFSIGDVEDSLFIWKAKTSSFDVGCGLDIQLLCGAGLSETKTFLASSTTSEAKAALEYLLKCEAAGDFEDWSPDSTLAFHRAYYRVQS